MRLTQELNIKVLAVLGFLFPASAFAQEADACDTVGNTLMSCTFDDGAKQVALCQTGNLLGYRFGADLEKPELSLLAEIGDLDYVPYSWDTDTILESVVLYNGDTSYEIFSTLPRFFSAGGTEGGITVTPPGQAPATLACDTNSVEPYRPFDGIGQLGSFTAEGSSITLANCLAAADDAVSCLGIVSEHERSENRCDTSDCWIAEAAAWDVQLAIETTIAIGAVKVLISDNFANDLQASQDSWHITRENDCKVYWPLLFAPDGGAKKCHAEYVAKRIDFLRDVTSRSEFQG